MKRNVEIEIGTDDLEGDILLKVEGRRKGKLKVTVDRRLDHEGLFFATVGITRAFMMLSREVHNRKVDDITEDLETIFDVHSDTLEDAREEETEERTDGIYSNIISLSEQDQALKDAIKYLSEVDLLNDEQLDIIFNNQRIKEFLHEEFAKHCDDDNFNPSEVYCEAIKRITQHLREVKGENSAKDLH